MNRLLKCVAGFAVAAVLAPSVAGAVDDSFAIDYRKQIMKTMGDQAAALFLVAQGKVPADNFALHVRALAETSKQVLKAFEPKVAGGTAAGEAKSEIWANWADFQTKVNDQVAALAALDKVASEGGMAAAAPQMQKALQCRGCHDTYRVKKQ